MSQLKDYGWSSHWEAAFDTTDSLKPARVIAQHRWGQYRVRTDDGEILAHITGRMRHLADGRAELPAVGDWVGVRMREDRAIIYEVAPRRTALVRKSADRAARAQVIAANLDTVFVVTSLNRDFNLRRIERYLALVWESGAQPVVVLSKLDLSPDFESLQASAASVAVGAPVHAVSALKDEGLATLRPYLRPGETVALVGSSGVGKSTLVNRLAGDELMDVREVRADDARGRHTTTHRELLRLPSGALLVDTPGMRELALWEGSDGMAGAFEDIEALVTQCRFSDCAHGSEPGCAVKAALADGTLDSARYANYQQLGRELAHLARKQDQGAQLEEKRRRKKFATSIRKRPRRNPWN